MELTTHYVIPSNLNPHFQSSCYQLSPEQNTNTNKQKTRFGGPSTLTKHKEFAEITAKPKTEFSIP